MKFTIERRLLIRMIERTRRGSRFARNHDPEILISACAARVFVTGPMATMGHEALVLADGECRVPTKKFLEVLRSYDGKENLTVEATDGALTIARFTMPITGFNSRPMPPSTFQLFPVTDLSVVPRG